MSDHRGIQVTGRRKKTQVSRIGRGKHDCVGREGNV